MSSNLATASIVEFLLKNCAVIPLLTGAGAYVALRDRCVKCYVRAPIPASVRGSKQFMTDGKRIPCVFYACDVCRKHLCRDCFHHVYDHHKHGRSFDIVTLR